MEPNRASMTAQLVACIRAQHYTYDTPIIFADPFAAQLVSADVKQRFEELYVKAHDDLFPNLAASGADHRVKVKRMSWESPAYAEALSRARYAEDKLAEAVEHGIDQYVIIGAGMDSFAFRCPEALAHVQIFEVDHPATQALKRQRIAEAGLAIPASMHLVPVDFTQESLATALRRSLYNPEALTFMNWLGVIPYLSHDTVVSTFNDIAQVAPSGSQVVFDYCDTDIFVPDKVASRVQRLIDRLRAIGEPVLSCFDTQTLSEELARIGCKLQEDLSPNDINMRYFHGRDDELRACEHVHFACAMVE